MLLTIAVVFFCCGQAEIMKPRYVVLCIMGIGEGGGAVAELVKLNTEYIDSCSSSINTIVAQSLLLCNCTRVSNFLVKCHSSGVKSLFCFIFGIANIVTASLCCCRTTVQAWSISW